MSAACGYAAGQQAYAVYQNGEAVTVKDVEKNIKVLEMAAQTGCPVVTFYNSVGAKLAEGLDVLTANAKLNAQIAKVSGVIPQVAVVLGVCGGTSALSAAQCSMSASWLRRRAVLHRSVHLCCQGRQGGRCRHRSRRCKGWRGCHCGTHC